MPRELDEKLRRIEDVARRYRMSKKLNPAFLLIHYFELLQAVRYLTRTPVNDLNPRVVESAKKSIQFASTSLYFHLDNTKFSTGFRQMVDDLFDFDMLETKDLLIDEKEIFRYLGMPDYLQNELFHNAEKIRKKFFERYIAGNPKFSFKEVLGPLIYDATTGNDPIVERSPFNWSRAIMGGLAGLSLTINGIVWSYNVGVSAISFTFGILLTSFAAGSN
jgi:hypothetical protein